MFPTIEELRLQCRIEHQDEDSLLLLYLTAAIKRAEAFLNRKLFENEVPADESEGIAVKEDIKLALMLAVCHWYDYRDSSKIPAGFYELLSAYRVISL